MNNTRELAEAVSAPGIDPRQWVSYGTVDVESEQSRSTEFSGPYGDSPLVDVKLHPSGMHARCRVASFCAGNGEGEHYPFVSGDEVIVVIPEGDERAAPVIVGRLNNAIDKFPTTVAGNDVTQNNFGFRRMRAPYMIETAQSYGIRNAITGTLFMMAGDGSVTLKNATGDYLHMGADFVGFFTTDDESTLPIASPTSTTMLMQFDKQKGQFLLEHTGNARLIMSKQSTALAANTPVSIAASGAFPSEHVTTIEAVVNLLDVLLLALAGLGAPTLLTTLADPTTRATALAGIVQTAGIPIPGNTGVLNPIVMASIMTALTTKLPNPTGLMPSIGCPGFFAG